MSALGLSMSERGCISRLRRDGHVLILSMFIDSFNLYHYSLDTPLNRADYSGLLSHQEVSLDVGNCGKYLWSTNWILAVHEQDGVILQKVCVKREVDPCPETTPQKNRCAPDGIKPAGCNNRIICPGQNEWTRYSQLQKTSVIGKVGEFLVERSLMPR